jgi:hypothetical protein
VRLFRRASLCQQQREHRIDNRGEAR